MSLTKADMAEMLFNELGLNKREAKEIVEQFFEEVKVALETGHQVKLSGFGNFLTRSKAERPGRNPKTGEEIPCQFLGLTVGVSPNIVDASFEALLDAIRWKLLRDGGAA